MTGLDELTSVVRHHHDTGAYAGHIIRVHPDALDAIRAASVPAPEQPAWQPLSFGAMFGLDLVRDETLPTGGWALVRVSYPPHPLIRRVETVVKAGTIEPQDGA